MREERTEPCEGCKKINCINNKVYKHIFLNLSKTLILIVICTALSCMANFIIKMFSLNETNSRLLIFTCGTFFGIIYHAFINYMSLKK
jgi:hypothetical protein